MGRRHTDPGSYRPALESAMHKTIKKVTEDIENLKFNTAIAAMMALLNEIAAAGDINHAEYKTLLLLANPFAPHITEEIWEKNGFGGYLHDQAWPVYDESKCQDATVEIAVQVCGKLKARITIPADCGKDDAIARAKEDERTSAAIEGKTIVKEIYVPGKLVNIVVK
ncbi:MAG: class I tRNA ligase family protein [Oscillospiraceae bacterium]